MPPKKARPQKRACDACYRRKIQCSFPNPEGPCEWCNHRTLECTFSRERPRKRQRNSVKSSDVQSLFRRVEQLEGALTQAETTQEPTGRNLPNPEEPALTAEVSPQQISTRTGRREWTAFSERSPSPPAFAQTSTDSCGYPIHGYPCEVTVSANQLGPNWFFNGIPISSEAGRQWISTRTGQTATWADFSIPIKISSPFSALQSSFSQEVCELPDKDSTREILNAFFRSSLRLEFPVLDQVLFEKTLETAYEPMDRMLFSPTQISARACVLSALSIASRLTASRQIPLSIDPDMCAAKAHCLLNHITGDISLATLQTALILQLRHAFGAHWQSAALFHSIACRIVCSLGGHIYQPSKLFGLEISLLERENRHIRMLFWLCYILDKDVSLRTGNPPLLTDVYCDLASPDTYLDYYTYLPGLDESSETNDKTNWHPTPHLLGDLHLSRLKEKVCRLLFSARALKDNDNQLLLNVRQLDDEIERWRLSIPVNFRPALFVSQNTSPNRSDESIPHTIRRLSLQLDYHHLMTVIHTTVRRCTADAPDGIRDLHDVVHSSFDLSLVASRSTLWCLKYIVSTIAEEAIRFITFYSTTAAMSLFLNIVIHPLDTQAQLDLEHLMSAANSMRSIPVHTLTQSDIDLAQEASNFVMRLVWLGTCAVTKAEREKKGEFS